MVVPDADPDPDPDADADDEELHAVATRATVSTAEATRADRRTDRRRPEGRRRRPGHS